MSRSMVEESMTKVRMLRAMVAMRLAALSMGYLLADATLFA